MSRTLPTAYKPPVPVHGRVLRTCRGIHIGGALRPRMAEFSADAELIQEALLEPRTAHAPRFLNRIAGAIWRWC